MRRYNRGLHYCSILELLAVVLWERAVCLRHIGDLGRVLAGLGD
jgi:hypothetical protein